MHAPIAARNAPLNSGRYVPVTRTPRACCIVLICARCSDPPPIGLMSGGAVGEKGYVDLKARVQNKLLTELDPSMDVSRTAEVNSAGVNGSMSADVSSCAEPTVAPLARSKIAAE